MKTVLSDAGWQRNIPAAPASVQTADVKFEVDSNGILRVTAVVKSNATNFETTTIPESSVHFFHEEIDKRGFRMV